MKKIMYFLIGLLLISFVRADTNVSIDVASNEGINFWANPSTPGETNYYLDGVDFKSTVNNLYARDMKMQGVYQSLSKVFMEKNYMKNIWEIVHPSELYRYEQRLRWVMDTYFVPRTEVNEMNNYYESRITDLSLRIEALEKILGEENVLKGRLNVAKDYNLTSLTYKDTTYTNVKDGFISLKPIEQPEVNETELNVSEEVKEAIIDLHQNMIENWQRMCDGGFKKWCVLLEQRNAN